MKIIATISLLFIFSYVFADNDPANDTYQGAEIITLNSSISGSLGYNDSITDKIDYYKIFTSEDGHLDFSITSSHYAITFSLIDNDGTTVINAINLGNNPASMMVYGLASGVYYIRVKSNINIPVFYDFSTTMTIEIPLNDIEPNDLANAIPLGYNETKSGHVGYRYNGGDIDVNDYYKISTLTTGWISFYINGTSSNSLDAHLYNSNMEDAAVTSNYGTNGILLAMWDLPADTYYLRLGAYPNLNYNGYTIRFDTLYPSSIPTIDNIEINVFPNPAIDNLYIALTSANKQVLNFDLINMVGQNVWANHNYTANGNALVEVPLTGLAKGVYFLRINQTATYKVVVN